MIAPPNLLTATPRRPGRGRIELPAGLHRGALPGQPSDQRRVVRLVLRRKRNAPAQALNLRLGIAGGAIAQHVEHRSVRLARGGLYAKTPLLRCGLGWKSEPRQRFAGLKGIGKRAQIVERRVGFRVSEGAQLGKRPPQAPDERAARVSCAIAARGGVPAIAGRRRFAR